MGGGKERLGWVGFLVGLSGVGLGWGGRGWVENRCLEKTVSPSQRTFLQCKSRGSCWVVELLLRVRVSRLGEGPVKDAQGRLRGL